MKEVYANFAKFWDAEIFNVDKWEEARCKRRKDKKLPKDPIEIMKNIGL